MDNLTLPPSPMQSLQAEHERLLARLDEAGGVPCRGPQTVPVDELSYDLQALINEAGAYIERARVESEWIVEARDRSQLRANLRFWASFLLNCTGTYPDTTLQPARTYRSQYPVKSDAAQDWANGQDASINLPDEINGVEDGDASLSTGQEALRRSDSDGLEPLTAAKQAWYSQVSRLLGLAAILIVGAIPLAAVCLALSLFYNLDNQSRFVWTGNFATQTAIAVSRLPSPTPRPAFVATSKPAIEVQSDRPVIDSPLVLAKVAFQESPHRQASCSPVLILDLQAPAEIDGEEIPPGKVVVSLAGTQQVVADGLLKPGSNPLTLPLGEVDLSGEPLVWLIQVWHPWIDLEAVILTGSAMQDCAAERVSITYGSAEEEHLWRSAMNSAPGGDLDLTWSLLTWGPDALEGQDWVAAIKLQGSGGNGKYVYFAQGDLATPPGAGLVNGLLADDQIVLGHKNCLSGVAQVGVTSAGQFLRRGLALRLVTPECR